MPTETSLERRPWALAAVSLATLMAFLDNNIVNVALPSIQRDLGLTTSGLEWVVSAYVLVFAGLLLAGGRLADAFGRKRFFVTGLFVFTAASLTAGLAGTDAVLIAARAVQGLGGALMMPASLAVVSNAYTEPRQRNASIALVTGVGALGLAIGPVVGGVLSQHASWGWIFLINVPLGIVTIGLSLWAVTESRESVRTGLDVPGLVASSLMLTALTWALIEGSGHGWTSPEILTAFAVAAAAALVFALIEQRSSHPMIDLSLFRDPVFSGGIGTVMLWGFALFGVYFFTSIYMQEVLGYSPTKAGLAFLPMALCMVIAAIVSEPVAHALGAHRVVGLSMLLMAAGLAMVGLLGKDVSFVGLMPSFVLLGVGAGLTTPLTSSVMAALPDERAGLASAVFNAGREVAGLLGVTVIGAILTARQNSDIRTGAAPLDAFLSGYREALLISAGLLVVGAVAGFLALRGTPSAASDAETPAVVPV